MSPLGAAMVFTKGRSFLAKVLNFLTLVIALIRQRLAYRAKFASFVKTDWFERWFIFRLKSAFAERQWIRIASSLRSLCLKIEIIHVSPTITGLRTLSVLLIASWPISLPGIICIINHSMNLNCGNVKWKPFLNPRGPHRLLHVLDSSWRSSRKACSRLFRPRSTLQFVGAVWNTFMRVWTKPSAL